ncbi:MAG TPA: ankyrin repeat domain-containing protein [Thermoanaerobaculia bacterium]|nr:ankyrin repeat domain-containing protein [Thermoanaerobaculia bacterium]
MSRTEAPSYRASLAEYELRAEALLEDLHAGDGAAAQRFKWEHPRYRDQPLRAVDPAELGLDDARLVVAHEHAFEDWQDLARFTDAVQAGGPVERFERAVESVVAGDLATLRRMLHEQPELVRARSTRRHHATLLHYLGANGVEGARQCTPPNAVDLAKLLLNAGAEVDALADMYDERCTTLSMLVSSSPPAQAGLQGALAELLLDHGAALDGPGSKWQSAILTALLFGFLDTAQVLARRGVRVDDLVTAAGLGRRKDAARLLPDAGGESRHAALALAAQLGHLDVVALLLDAGEDPSRYNPEGHHAHATPLHQAVWAGHQSVVRLLVERGARLDIRDTIFDATPLDWASYGQRTEIAELLRQLGAPEH